MKVFKWMIIPADEYNVLISNYAKALERVKKIEKENKYLLQHKTNEQECKTYHSVVSIFDILTWLPEGTIINDFELVSLFPNTTWSGIDNILQDAVKLNVIQQIGNGKYKKL